VLNGALRLSPRSAGKRKRRRLAALHNPPGLRAGARRIAPCSGTERGVECGEVSPLSMPAERENRRKPLSLEGKPARCGQRPAVLQRDPVRGLGQATLRICLAALHNPPGLRAGARRIAACSRQRGVWSAVRCHRFRCQRSGKTGGGLHSRGQARTSASPPLSPGSLTLALSQRERESVAHGPEGIPAAWLPRRQAPACLAPKLQRGKEPNRSRPLTVRRSGL
jgi:hypothetical protein